MMAAKTTVAFLQTGKFVRPGSGEGWVDKNHIEVATLCTSLQQTVCYSVIVVKRDIHRPCFPCGGLYLGGLMLDA